MQIKHPEVYSIIESIAAHFNGNISNRFTRASLSLLPLDSTTWSQIEEMTEKAANYRYQGYHLDELYGMILGMARFVSAARKQGTQPFKSPAMLGRLNPQDKILFEMVINNFSSNLNVLADQVNKLYLKVVELDKQSVAPGKSPVYAKYGDLAQLGRFLVG